jgi:hypothetical protein
MNQKLYLKKKFILKFLKFLSIILSINFIIINFNIRSSHDTKEGTLILTTHRILWVKDSLGLEIPLFYIYDYKKEVKL